MESLGTGDWIVFGGAAYVAIVSLVRLMIRHRGRVSCFRATWRPHGSRSFGSHSLRATWLPATRCASSSPSSSARTTRKSALRSGLRSRNARPGYSPNHFLRSGRTSSWISGSARLSLVTSLAPVSTRFSTGSPRRG